MALEKCRWASCATLLLLFAKTGLSSAADRIYRCEQGGKVTYSDRVCADSAKETEVQPGRLNSYSVQHPESRDVKKAEPIQRAHRDSSNESIVAEQQRAKQRCERLADRLTAIEAKLRRGYTVDQGERLKDQRRQIEQQQRTERCR